MVIQEVMTREQLRAWKWLPEPRFYFLSYWQVSRRGGPVQGEADSLMVALTGDEDYRNHVAAGITPMGVIRPINTKTHIQLGLAVLNSELLSQA
jgi:hypothetical protein